MFILLTVLRPFLLKKGWSLLGNHSLYKTFGRVSTTKESEENSKLLKWGGPNICFRLMVMIIISDNLNIDDTYLKVLVKFNLICIGV